MRLLVLTAALALAAVLPLAAQTPHDTSAALAGVNSIEHAYRVQDSTLTLMAKNGVTMVPADIDSLTLLQYSKLSNQAGPPMTPDQIRKFMVGQRDRLMMKAEPCMSAADR